MYPNLRARLGIAQTLFERARGHASLSKISSEQSAACIDLLKVLKLNDIEVKAVADKVALIPWAETDAERIHAEVARHQLALVSTKKERRTMQDYTNFQLFCEKSVGAIQDIASASIHRNFR